VSRRIWIVGASSGIGAELARQWSHEADVSLILSARRAPELAASRAACKSTAHVDLAPFDVCDAQSRDECVRRVLTDGPPDLLVITAGISQRSLALETRPDVERRLFETNYFGPIAIVRPVAQAMVARGKGHIVVVSSLAGKLGTPLRSSYAASKHALHGYLDCLRAEIHDRGVLVSVVAPGFIRTEITLKSLTGDGRPYGRIDPAIANGVAVDLCANRIICAVNRREPEVVVAGPRETAAALIRRAWPKLFFRLARQARSL
jgi:dehydrogenase/reductase SDR family member 7B